MSTRQEFEEAYKESHYSLWWNSSNDLFLTDERGCYYDRDAQESWEAFSQKVS